MINFGIAGIGYASIFTNALVLTLFLLILAKDSSMRDAIFWPDKRTFKGLCTQLSVGFPMMLMICMDQWIFEIMIFNAGFFGVTEQAA
jgi:Na+-driven multidrug efflux pump